MVSGVGLNAFWMSSYLWDVTSLIPAAAFTLIVLAAADVDTLIDGEAAWATVLLFVLFGFSMVGLYPAIVPENVLRRACMCECGRDGQ